MSVIIVCGWTVYERPRMQSDIVFSSNTSFTKIVECVKVCASVCCPQCEAIATRNARDQSFWFFSAK